MLKRSARKRFIIRTNLVLKVKMGLKSEIKGYHEKTSRSDSKGLVSYWDEEEFWNGDPTEVFSVIFRTQGCRWSYESGCSMCGYFTDTNPEINQSDLEKQIETALEGYDGEKIVKIYTSGSFLDAEEVSEDTALNLLESFDKKDAEKIVVESRPEFIENELVKKYSKKINQLEIAVGLESAEDFILENCINKGFTFDFYKKKLEKLPDTISTRTYLLLKPPFLTEKEAKEDVLNSINKISELTDIISINPVNIQNGTYLENLWRKNLYSPPWLWTIIDILSEARLDKNRIVVSQAGLGSERGASNCEECDEQIIRVIERINQTNDKKYLEDIPSCDCKKEWKIKRKIEPYLHFRGSPDILRNRYTGYV